MNAQANPKELIQCCLSLIKTQITVFLDEQTIHICYMNDLQETNSNISEAGFVTFINSHWLLRNSLTQRLDSSPFNDVTLGAIPTYLTDSNFPFYASVKYVSVIL